MRNSERFLGRSGQQTPLSVRAQVAYVIPPDDAWLLQAAELGSAEGAQSSGPARVTTVFVLPGWFAECSAESIGVDKDR